MSVTGCAGLYGDGPKLIDGKPEWYFNPSKDGHIGGVGVSGLHKNVKTGQKQLAVERALAEIARQMGVKVDSYSSVHSQSAAGMSSTSGQAHSFFTVDGQKVDARIEQVWEDKYSGELYIWMVTK